MIETEKKAKAQKEKEKAKLVKEKAKAKAKLVKEKEKAKLVKEKEKAKLVKIQNGGNRYATNMYNYHKYMKMHKDLPYDVSNIDHFFANEATKFFNDAYTNKEVLHDTVYKDYSKEKYTPIIDKLVSSNKSNKFEEFWDNIVKLYTIGEYNIITTDVYEEMRASVAVDDLYDSRIMSKVCHNCIFLNGTLRFEICKPIQFSELDICNHITTYITKLLKFKQTSEYNDKYFLQNIGVVCANGGAHRLKLIITPDDEISIIDPDSISLNYSGYDEFFDNLYKIYKRLEKIEILVSHKKYSIVLPQLDSALNIQTMLSVGDIDRKGACTIISNLIVHVMVHMCISSKKAVNLISTTIVRKFILNTSVESFADGYLLFLYNIGFYNDPTNQPLINKPEVAETLEDFLKTLTLEMKGDDFLPGLYKKLFTKAKDSPQRIPLEKLSLISPMRSPVAVKKTRPTFLDMFKKTILPWKKGTKFNLKPDLENKTPIYVTNLGLMPFKTVCPLVPKLSQEDPFVLPEPFIKNVGDKELLENEIEKITKHEEHITGFIYAKIGEILIVKYTLDKLLPYFYLDLSDFKSSPDICIQKFGKGYVEFLKKKLENYNV
jgi:hypothetical protein